MPIDLLAGEQRQLDVALVSADPLKPRPPDETWPQGYATLHGYVTQDPRHFPEPGPIEGATVWEGWFGADTDANGYYILNAARDMRHLCPDGWQISCNHNDYAQQMKTVFLKAGDIIRLDFVLEPR